MENGIGWVLIVMLVAVVYFLPSIIATRQKAAIFALNLLLGWTFLGWVMALVWALSKPEQVTSS